ncbi:hypothetical protein BC834DRAFT_345080 [Gloeopeniophorella convolvens]|nr:hypothetical protein BC834DRAFT_345080 [Gloeopeniophorella convolvens]
MPSPVKMPPAETLVPPLPTAAAHHPQHMEVFLSPVTSTSFGAADLAPMPEGDCGQVNDSTTPRANVLITECLAAEEQSKSALKEALNRMRIMREGLQAQLHALAESSSAQAQSGVPSEGPTPPPADSKDVTADVPDVRIRDLAARPPAQGQPARAQKPGSRHSVAFPLPKTSQAHAPFVRPRAPPVPTADPPRATRPLKMNATKHKIAANSSQLAAPASFAPRPSAADSREEASKLSPVRHQFADKARPTATGPRERKAPIYNFEEDEAFLPAYLRPDIKPPATPRLDFIEDNSTFLPSFLKRDAVQSGPRAARQEAARASVPSSRASTPERGSATPSAGAGSDEDDWIYEGKSMTLRDILVRAGDATFAHFDILHEEDVDVADETLGWD